MSDNENASSETSQRMAENFLRRIQAEPATPRNRSLEGPITIKPTFVLSAKAKRLLFRKRRGDRFEEQFVVMAEEPVVTARGWNRFEVGHESERADEVEEQLRRIFHKDLTITDVQVRFSSLHFGTGSKAGKILRVTFTIS